MNRPYFVIGLFFGLFLFISRIFAVTYPTPTGYVNDFAGILSPETKTTLETTLSNYEKETKHEISVAIIPSLDGTYIESYAVELFEQWKIGKKGADNGVLLLVSKEDRELRIEVGYGLEGVITDGKAGDIIRNVITPAFKEGNYDKGITDGVNAIMKLAKGEIVDIPSSGRGGNGGEFPGQLIVFGFIMFNLFASYVAGFLGRTKATWPGGAIGAILGLIGGALLSTWAIGIFFAIIFGIIGFILDAILSKNYKERVARGLPTSFGSSWGGFSSSSRSSGGFGGFGGGRSGGGGASGRW